MKEIHPNIKIINHYGPTETTVGVLIHPLDNMDDLVKNNIVIGKPICNVDVRILDENKNDVPMYGIGELYISGASVSNGYINQTELTKERFCKLENQNVWYRTGDLVRWNEEGLILYEGRKDTQVKIRGYRVEMSEIEKSLRVIEGITDAYACILQETGEKELVAFYVAPSSISQNTFTDILSHKLPIYMVPNRYIRVNDIPLLMNGKVDAKKLNSYKIQVQDSVEIIYPQNDMQRKVYMIWKKVITNKNFGIRDNFFNIGGDSIKAVQVISLLNSYDIKLHDIYHYQTIEELSAYLINRKSSMNVEISTCKIDENSVDTIMNKIVYSVQPFNDLYYQSCYYNAFFSLAQYWEKDIIHIMTNDTIHYNILNVENKLNFEVLYTYSEIINVVIEKYGIGLNAYLKCDKLSQSIVAALVKKRMIIVRVDCFYEPLREEMFQKQHWAHYLLVIGYDLEKKLFYVLEHSGINELDYTVQNISFFDLEKAYYGYCEYFCNNNVEVPTYFEFCKRQEQVYLNSAINNFKLVINKNIDTYRNNMEVIGRLDQFLQNIIVEEEMISHVTSIYSGINNLMLSKKALFYILNKLLKPKEELLSMADNLRYKINIINGKLMKSMVKGSMSNKEWKGFVLKFKEYAEGEIEFLNKMIQFSETID